LILVAFLQAEHTDPTQAIDTDLFVRGHSLATVEAGEVDPPGWPPGAVAGERDRVLAALRRTQDELAGNAAGVLARAQRRQLRRSIRRIVAGVAIAVPFGLAFVAMVPTILWGTLSEGAYAHALLVGCHYTVTRAELQIRIDSYPEGSTAASRTGTGRSSPSCQPVLAPTHTS
jgi:hypothetical protein